MSTNNAAGSMPFYFDFRAGLGHFVIAGQPSAGKSVLMSEIAAMFAAKSSDAPKPLRMNVLVHRKPGAGMTLWMPLAGDNEWK